MGLTRLDGLPFSSGQTGETAPNEPAAPRRRRPHEAGAGASARFEQRCLQHLYHQSGSDRYGLSSLTSRKGGDSTSYEHERCTIPYAQGVPHSGAALSLYTGYSYEFSGDDSAAGVCLIGATERVYPTRRNSSSCAFGSDERWAAHQLRYPGSLRSRNRRRSTAVQRSSSVS